LIDHFDHENFIILDTVIIEIKIDPGLKEGSLSDMFLNHHAGVVPSIQLGFLISAS
jgi:hypothetical protein